MRLSRALPARRGTSRHERARPVLRPPVPSLVLCALLLLAGATPSAAQSRTSSALRGTVVGTDGSPIPDAAVTIVHDETGVRRTAGSNSEGRFLFPLLQPGGPYTLTVTNLGYAVESVEDIELQVGQVYTARVVLAEEAIELEGLEVDVERTEIFNPTVVGPATRLTERTVESMPILSRDVMELAVLSPLVKTTESGGFSIAGQNDRYNAILVDGILSKDLFGLTSGGVPGGQAGAKLIPLDAVAQYEILVAPFDVRLSGFTGGVMNAVTRTGTNRWRVRAAAVHRAEALIGDLSLPTGPVDASGVDRSLVAISIGGPIQQDRAHFYVTGEFEERHQPPTGFNLGRDEPTLVRIAPDALADFQESFAARYGLDVGTGAPYPLGQQLANVFARVDWQLGGGHRLSARHLFAGARNDESPNRFSFDPYGLSSNAVFRESRNHITSLQLFSELGPRVANEMELTFQRTTDETTPASDWPQVEVGMLSTIGEVSFLRPLRVGGQFFAQDNELRQSSLRLTNSLNLDPASGSTYALGVTGSYYDIDHRYLPGSEGEYFFSSSNDYENGAAQRYQRTVLAEGQDPWVDIGVIELGAFVQNRIDAGDNLTMHFGIRVDAPFVLDRPQENLEIFDVFGYHTSDVPSGQPLLSPRWGFNWQSDGRRTTQVRGGGGMFVGQIPYVWLSNAFHNDGLRSKTVLCLGRLTDDPPTGNTVPLFDPLSPPQACEYGPFHERRAVVAFEEGFKYPQDLKFSVAVDRELSDRISGTLGALFNKAINQVGLRELNLERGGGSINAGLGGADRRSFKRLEDDRGTILAPDYDQVLLVTNEGEDWGASVTAELRGGLTEGLQFQLGYALARAWDRTSLVFTDMMSNYGMRPTSTDPNSHNLTTSNFDRPHKIVAAVFGAPFPGLPQTEVSLLYTGQSGLPFSYVYRFDVNNDGYPGLGGAFDRTNDLLYVPRNLSDLPAAFATQALFDRAMREDPCLSEVEPGDFVERNGCRAPWENRLDLRLAHTLDVGGARVRLEGDLINVLNLLNADWGTVESVRPVVPLIDGSSAAVIWSGTVLTQRDEEGRLQPSDPWHVVSPDSQWQMQFGARVTFGN